VPHIAESLNGTMKGNWSLTMTSIRPNEKFRDVARAAAIGLILVGSLIPAVRSRAADEADCTSTYCFTGLLLDESDQRDEYTCFDRVRFADRFTWNDHAWALVNAGNDLLLYDLQNLGRGLTDRGGYGLGQNCAMTEPPRGTITGPEPAGAGLEGPEGQSPKVVSAFDFLDTYSVCDAYGSGACRFAFSNYSHDGAAGFAIDFGSPTGARPYLEDYWKYPDIYFGATWGLNGNQYVIVKGFAESEGCTDGWGVFRVVAGSPPVFTYMQCAPSNLAPRYSKQAHDLLFTFDRSNVQVWGLDPTTGMISDEADGSGISGYGESAMNIDAHGYDGTSGSVVMVVTDVRGSSGTAQLFEVTGPGTSAVVTRKYTFPDPPGFDPPSVKGWFSSAVNRGPTGHYVFLEQNLGIFTGHRVLYDITDLTNPVALDGGATGYWSDPNSDFNQAGFDNDDALDFMPIFSFDGTQFLMMRKYMLARFQYGGPPVPTAGLEMQPAVRFPGDTVTLKDRSTSADGVAMWITDGSGTKVEGDYEPPTYDLNPPTDDVVWNTAPLQPMAFDAGCTTLSPGPYTAHVEIIPSGEEDRVDRVISFQCRPGAAISVYPSTAMTGEVVTLTGTVDGGTPIQWEWKVTDPANTTTPTTHPAGNGTGTDSLDVSITQAGEWKFELTAVYQHTVDGSSWEAVAVPVVKTYSSVAPVLDVVPGAPRPTDVVTLKGDQSLLGANLTVSYTYTLNSAEQCSGTFNSNTDTVPDCEIGTLSEGSYTAVLTLDPDDGSTPVSDTRHVTVTDTDFSISPTDPEIGEIVTFYPTKTPWSGEWDFGDQGCVGYGQKLHCPPGQICGTLPPQYKYADSGVKTVTFTPTGGSPVSRTLTVQPKGSCSGGVTCTYSISPAYFNVPASGGRYTLRITASSPTCGWSATSLNPSWIGISPTRGSGTKALNVTVLANGAAKRQGSIRVIAGKSYTINVNQAAGVVCDPIDATYTWTPDRDTFGVGETVHFIDTSSGVTSRRWEVFQDSWLLPGAITTRDFYWTPPAVGNYSIKLTVHNECQSSDVREKSFTVTEEAPSSLMFVSGAAHAPGLEGTLWRTDVNLFNPTSEPLQVELQLLPYGQDNSDPQYTASYFISPHKTRRVEDVVKALWGDVSKLGASVGIKPVASTSPSVAARTYNETPYGTYGSFIPMFSRPVTAGVAPVLGGLRADSAYRTNVFVTNHTDEAIGDVAIEIYNTSGSLVGTTDARLLPPYSTVQFVKVGDGLGLELFSIRVTAPADRVSVSASVVENVSGDSVLVVPNAIGDSVLYLPGLAHVPGKHGTFWRTDLAFTNPAGSGTNVQFNLHLWRQNTRTWETETEETGMIPLAPGGSFRLEDVLGPGGNIFPGASEDDAVLGYAWVEVKAGSAAPLIQAQTYTTIDGGGAYGQGVAACGEDQLLERGEAGFVAGISNSTDGETGFRSNLGFLCTGESNCVVGLRVYGSDGTVLAERSDVVVAPMKYLQASITSILPDLAGQDVFGSLEVTVLDGGPLVAFATIVDNATNDGIFVPVLKN